MTVTLSQMRRDLRGHLEASMSVDLTITPPAGSSVTISGYGTSHHMSYDPNTGRPVSSKNAHCSFFEKTLTDAGYTVRVSDEVNLIGHKVSYIDSAGIERNYRINESYPDETLGLIVCILGEDDS